MKIAIAGNLEKEGLPKLVDRIVRRLAREGVEFVIHDKLARLVSRAQTSRTKIPSTAVVTERQLANSDLLLSLGGDGTILRMARLVASHRTPILGINLGKLGFLAEVSVDALDDCLNDVLEKNYILEERTMLQASLPTVPKPYYALNDIVVDRHGSARMMDIATYVNNEYLATFTADGIIISTPTGSTAYSLSNGGPILTPTNHAIIVSPICPHTLTVRPVIVPDSSVLRLNVEAAGRRVHLTADGQQERLLAVPATVTVKKSPYTARLVRRRGRSFYDVLRTKLHWGRDVRQAKH